MTIIDAQQVELELARKLFWLVAHDLIFFSNYNEDIKNWDDGNYPIINCNDIFIAGADCEPLLLEEIDKYLEICQKYPKLYPEYLWCIAKRSEKPWRKSTVLTSSEHEALQFICNLLGTENPYGENNV